MEPIPDTIDKTVPPASESAAVPWAPSPSWQRVAKIVREVVVFGGVVAACFLLFDAAEAWGYPSLAGLLVGLPVAYAVVALHELGHLLAARFAGMAVMRAHVGSVELKARRQGWSMRWKAPTLRVDGMVMAFPDPDQPIGPQMMAFAAGGPCANIAAALLAAGVAAIPAVEPGTACVLSALAIYSAVTAVANLLPTSAPMPSDGLLLLRLRRGIDENDLGLLFIRVNGEAVKGVTADRVPDAVRQRFREGPTEMRLFDAWIELHACVHRGDMAGIAAISPRLDALLAEIPEGPQRQSWAAFEALVRSEIRFAAALAGDEAPMPPEDIGKETDWQRPTLRPRLRALAAARAGDRRALERALDEAERLAEDSPDAAGRVFERRLRDEVRALLAN